MCALKVLEAQLEVINDEFQYKYNHNPIEHIKTRVKTVDSIEKKLEKYGYDFSVSNIVKYINDVIGARIVCSFKSDIYDLVNIIKKSSILEVIEEKDYIKKPKPSGYSSYHLIVKVPVNISNQLIYVKVEIQIRTVAMDFWASIEHKLKYKKGINAKASKELVSMAKIMNKLDEKVMKIRYNT